MIFPKVKSVCFRNFIDLVATRISITENQICFTCHLKRGGVDYREEVTFERVQFVGYFRKSRRKL